MVDPNPHKLVIKISQMGGGGHEIVLRSKNRGQNAGADLFGPFHAVRNDIQFTTKHSSLTAFGNQIHPRGNQNAGEGEINPTQRLVCSVDFALMCGEMNTFS